MEGGVRPRVGRPVGLAKLLGRLGPTLLGELAVKNDDGLGHLAVGVHPTARARQRGTGAVLVDPFAGGEEELGNLTFVPEVDGALDVAPSVLILEPAVDNVIRPDPRGISTVDEVTKLASNEETVRTDFQDWATTLDSQLRH